MQCPTTSQQSINPEQSSPSHSVKRMDSSIPSSLKEIEEQYSSVLDFQEISEELIEKIGKEIIRLTTSWQNKSINTLNKQFQNSVMNYFLECYVSELLVGDFKVEFKRDVFKTLTAKMEQEEGANLKKRYITLLNYFLQALDSHNKISSYVNLLLNLILDPITTEVDTIDYQTQYRKKMTALLLLEHAIHSDRKTKFTDFYSLWTHVFTFAPLKRKKSKTLLSGKSPKKIQNTIKTAKPKDVITFQGINSKSPINYNQKRKNTATSAMTDVAVPQGQFDNMSQSSQQKMLKKVDNQQISIQIAGVQTINNQLSQSSSPLSTSSQFPSSTSLQQGQQQLQQAGLVMIQQQNQLPYLQQQQQSQQFQMQQQQELFNYYCLQQYQLQQQSLQFQQKHSLMQLLAQQAGAQPQFLQIQLQQPLQQLQHQTISLNPMPQGSFNVYQQNPFCFY